MSKLDTPAVRERLAQIKRTAEGPLRPDDVVEDARQGDSPLHPLFEWDDVKAAQEQRLDRAREIIRVVHVTMVRHECTLSVPQYIREPPDEDDRDQGYGSTVEIVSDRERRRACLDRELTMAEGILRRVLNLAIALDEVPLVQRRLLEAIGGGTPVKTKKKDAVTAWVDGGSAAVKDP